MQNEWLNEEIKHLRCERLYKKQSVVFGWMLIFLTGFTALIGYDMQYSKQHSLRWAATWKCKKCGYENYDEIGTCPICGSPKPKRR